MTTPARAAVVGAGLMGLWHARALTRAGASLALVVDQDLHTARRLAGRYPRCAAATTLEELSPREIRVVHVCTATSSHAAIIRTALDAGCHVLVEKPLADDEATTRDVLALAESRGRLLCPVHQVLFQRGTRQALAALDRLRPLHVDLVMCSAGAEFSAHGDDEIVAEILPHPLSFLLRVLPGTAQSTEWVVTRAGVGELRAMLASSAGTASLLISTHGRPTVNAARIIGERATAHLDFFHGFAVLQDGAVSRTRKAVQPLRYSSSLGFGAAWNLLDRSVKRQTAYPGLWELVSAFYEQVMAGGVSPISTEEVVRVAAMRDAVLAKATR